MFSVMYFSPKLTEHNVKIPHRKHFCMRKYDKNQHVLLAQNKIICIHSSATFFRQEELLNLITLEFDQI